MDNKIEKKTVLVPNNVIDYAEGGIVSKEFIHSNAGSVTLFAFDKGLNIIDGVAEIMIEDELYHPKAGEMIIIPARARHAVNANDRFKMTITMIRG